MARELAKDWIYPTIEISQDKRVPRTSTAPKFAHELTGVDGSLQGGLVPITGFDQVYELDPSSNGQNTNHGAKSFVTDVEAVTFNLGRDDFAYGWVYRVKRDNNSLRSDVLMDYFNKDINVWRRGVVLISNVDQTANMSVSTFGGLVYVSIKGFPTARFYMQRGGIIVNQLTTSESGTGTTSDYYGTGGVINYLPANPTSAAGAVGSVTITNYANLTIPSKATATFTFGDTEFDDNNDATITLIDHAGLSKTYKIKNDYSANAASLEFNAGASANTAATNFKILVESSTGHNGTITVEVTDGKVDLTQNLIGTAGNKTISSSSSPSFPDICDVNPPAAFTGGTDDKIQLVSSNNTTYTVQVAVGNTTNHTTTPTFISGTSNAQTAINLASAINATDDFSAVVDTTNNAKVNITQLVGGTRGNTTITLTDTGSTGASVVNFTGGTNAKAGSEIITTDTGPGKKPVLYSPEELNNFKVLDIRVPERHTVDNSCWAKLALLDADPIPIWDLKYKQGTRGYYTFNRNVDREVTMLSDTFSTDFTTDFLTTEGFNLKFTTGVDDTLKQTTESKRTSGDGAGVAATATITMDAIVTVGRTITLIDRNGDSLTYTAQATENPTSRQFKQGGTVQEQLTSLKTCIEHSSGHNGDIIATDMGGFQLKLTQNDGGDSGNTAITTTITAFPVPTAFTGGADLTTSSNTNTTYRTESTIANVQTTSLLMTETDDFDQGDIERKPRQLKKGSYAFAVQFANSTTGLRSGLSEIAHMDEDDFVNVVNDESSSSDEANSLVVANLYVGMHLQYDREKWDRAYLYRSVRTEDAGGVTSASVLHLDRVIILDEFELETDTTLYPTWRSGFNFRNAIYWYELEDKQLIYQQPYLDQALFDENMPYGGASEMFEGTMLMSDITGTPSNSFVAGGNDTYKNMGEFRWSSLSEISPELFPVTNQYLPEEGNMSVITFEKASSNLIGFSKDRLYHIRKTASNQGGFIRINEMHKGYGIVNPKAATAVGSTIYFLTTKGLKSVDSTGRLDDVKAIDELIHNTWKDDLEVCELQFDPEMSALYIFNPTLEEAVCFWFNTGKVTSMEDMSFTTSTTGFFPVDRTTNSTDINHDGVLEKRTMFIQNYNNSSTYPDPPSLTSATATFTFGTTEFDDVNNASITLIDAEGLSKTYIIKNDYSANDSSTNEFNAGASPSVAASNFKIAVEAAHGHNGSLTVVANASAGQITITQRLKGTDGNTTIAHTSNFDSITSTNVGDAFVGGKGWRPKVWIYDRKDSNTWKRMLNTHTNPSGSASDQTHHFQIEAYHTTGGNYFQLGSNAFDQSDLYKYLYVTSGTTSNLDNKYQIVEITNDTTAAGASSAGKQRIRVLGVGNTTYNLDTTHYLTLSPRIFRFVGHPLMDIAADGVVNAIDYHSVKHVSAIDASITDISFAPNVLASQYKVGLFEGNSATALASNRPTNRNGTATSGFSTELSAGIYTAVPDRNGTQGTNITPFFFAYVTGFTFRLISLLVSGKILSSRNRNHPGV